MKKLPLHRSVHHIELLSDSFSSYTRAHTHTNIMLNARSVIPLKMEFIFFIDFTYKFQQNIMFVCVFAATFRCILVHTDIKMPHIICLCFISDLFLTLPKFYDIFFWKPFSFDGYYSLFSPVDRKGCFMCFTKRGL